MCDLTLGHLDEATLAGCVPRASELQFRRLLEKLPAGAYTCDPQGLITYYNQHAVDLWGRAPRLNDPVDRFCGSFKLFSADGKAIRHDQCWMALALCFDKEYSGEEIVIQRPDGSRATALAYANPIHDESNTLIGAVNVLVEISDRKRAEEALKHADRAKNEFLAALAHELRNPLAPISNSLHILRLAEDLAPGVQRLLEIMEQQTRHLVRLVDDLLEVSRITNGKVEMRKETVELATIVANAVEISRPLMDAAGHQFAVTLPAEPILFNADPVRLTQVIANLLNNAAKYSDEGGQIWLTSRREGDEIVVSVRDTGMGIHADMLPHVFDMFAQADRALTRARGGLGIGLTLVRTFVEMHGGRIEAHSEGIGKGSEFVVRLPLSATAAPRGEIRPSLPRSQSAPPRRRILIVDDMRAASYVLGRLLGKMGQEVRVADDPAAALQLVRAERPDVIISDIGMPKMDGYQFAQCLREEPGLKDTVLVALTGYGQEDDERRAREAGFDHYLVKPVALDELQDLLEKLAINTSVKRLTT
jgi:signal transduction histidine kinase/CheY-like chemotaxis protein